MLTYCLLAITALAGVLGSPVGLEPAFTLRIGIEDAISIGPVIQGYGLSYSVSPNGTIVSAPGAAVSVNATILAASDMLYVDPDGKRLRINADGVAKTTSGTIFRFRHTGVVTLDEKFKAILSHAPGSQSNDFGNIVSHHTFEIPVAAPELAGLDENIYVGVGRLLVNPDRSIAVEYVAGRVITEAQTRRRINRR